MNPPGRPPRPDDFDPRAFEDDDPFDTPARRTSTETSAERRRHLAGRETLSLSRFRTSLRWKVLAAIALTIGTFIFWKEVLSALMWVLGAFLLWIAFRAYLGKSADWEHQKRRRDQQENDEWIRQQREEWARQQQREERDRRN